ncbi:MAG: hypothetical protein ACR2RL_21535 [Gammaproteobacteria bacterium]
MGYDIYGRRPSAESGEYFRASMHAWEVIIRFMRAASFSPPKAWLHNEGAGFTKTADCRKLAARLEVRMANVGAHWGCELPRDCQANRQLVALRNAMTSADSSFANMEHSVNPRAEELPKVKPEHESRFTHYTVGELPPPGPADEVVEYESVDREQLLEWIAFLKSCGGFRIK